MTPVPVDEDIIADSEGGEWAVSDGRRDPNEPELTEDDVNAVYDRFSSEFRRSVQTKTRDLLHNVLLLGGDPKDYRGVYQVVGSVAESLLLYAVARGFVVLSDDATADEETQRERAEKREEAKKQAAENPLAAALAQLGAGGGRPPADNPAGYL